MAVLPMSDSVMSQVGKKEESEDAPVRSPWTAIIRPWLRSSSQTSMRSIPTCSSTPVRSVNGFSPSRIT